MGSPIKTAPLRISKLKLHLLCEWRGCSVTFEDMHVLDEHVKDHIESSLEAVSGSSMHLPGSHSDLASPSFGLF